MIAMDGWIRPSVREDFGDSLVACGALGLIAGTFLHNPSIGVIFGLILGAVVDAVLVVRQSHADV
jgi:uncharacterized protein YqgC (DUF456 family)